ncbi:MAG TPA: hypothetical protein DDX07_10010 [Porphyromonadaceae bacterium]|nr:hypothetical protein [Porphyromonadaceae bacterium]
MQGVRSHRHSGKDFFRPGLTERKLTGSKITTNGGIHFFTGSKVFFTRGKWHILERPGIYLLLSPAWIDMDYSKKESSPQN